MKTKVNQQEAGLSPQTAKDRAGMKAFVAATIGSNVGYQVMANELDDDRSIILTEHETIMNDDGCPLGVSMVVHKNGEQSFLFDVNNDGLAEIQAVDLDSDNAMSPNEVIDLSGMNVDMLSPAEDILISGLDMLHHDNELPDYMNDADISSF